MSETPNIVTVTEENFAFAVLERSQEVPVLVDFWADWCAPCRVLSPVLDKLAAEMEGKLAVTKVNSDEQKQLAMQYGVRSLPTVKLFRNGQIVDEFMGALPEGQIRAFLDKHIPRESDALVAQAQASLAAGDSSAAGELLNRARVEDPGNPRVNLALAHFKLSTGEYDAARTAIEALPLDEQDKPEVQRLKATLDLSDVAAGLPTRDRLEQTLASDAFNAEARQGLALHQIMAGDFDAALENLLQVILAGSPELRDAARESMLAAFTILGDDERVAQYRRRMFNALH